MGAYCGILLWEPFVGVLWESCGSLLWEPFEGAFLGCPFREGQTFREGFCGSFLWDPFVGAFGGSFSGILLGDPFGGAFLGILLTEPFGGSSSVLTLNIF